MNLEEDLLPPDEITFEVRVETSLQQVHKQLQKALQSYKDEKRGPTLLAVQSTDGLRSIVNQIPYVGEFPNCEIHIQVS